MSEKMTLEERVIAFKRMELPGQPMGMHMGTSYLVDDLWREIQRLNDTLSMTRGGSGAITAAAPKSPPPPKSLR